MGRFREAIAILIKPNDALLYPETQERFRGRARVQQTSGVNHLGLIAIVLFLLLIIGSWLLTGFGFFRAKVETADPTPVPPSIQPARLRSGVTNGFDTHYTGEVKPDLPTTATAPVRQTPDPVPEPIKPRVASTNGTDPTLSAVQELTRAMTAMAEKQNHLAERLQQLEKPASPKPQQTPAAAVNQKTTAVTDAAKTALEARRSGGFWLEKKKDKDGVSYYRRGRLGEYRLASGWNIPIELQDEASNQSPGLYGFIVRETVYDSATGTRVVLPQYAYGMVNITGGRLFGDVELPASLVSLNLPDGTPIKVGETSVGDAAGRSGFRDQVDHRTWNIIVTTLVRSGLRIGTVGMIGGVSNDVVDRAGVAVVAEGLRETDRQVQQFANTSPIHTVRPGYLGNIKVKDPIDLGILYGTR